MWVCEAHSQTHVQKLLPDTQMYTVYRPMLYVHTNTHTYNCYITYTRYCVVCAVYYAVPSLQQFFQWMLSAFICMCDWPGNTGPAPYALSLGQAATPLDSHTHENTIIHTHTHTHTQTHTHTHTRMHRHICTHIQLEPVIENLQTISEMITLSSHNHGSKALEMVSWMKRLAALHFC